ncbi:MAG TPA: 3'-5' exonuclease, partial [Burkholderiaceae bacterium]|nr:3'-5' exonuclease [Burkholderiaceae bacterium]
NQVTGNLSAFIELALNLDAGRYPSLPKFIAALNEFQVSDEGDAPDESQVESTADAVRIMTIHSAKGLEARLVVMVDANHSEGMTESGGILVEWPLTDTDNDATQQKHFSVYGRKDQRGAARNALFTQEEELADQENWNLLYVAMTRARQWLIVSGVAKNKVAIAEDSWYGRLQAVPEMTTLLGSASTLEVSDNAATEFELTTFVPQRLPQSAVITSIDAPTEAQREGIALHALMERLTGANMNWPIAIPDVAGIARWVACPLDQAQVIRHQAEAILGNPELTRFFDPSCYQFARNEMNVQVQHKLLRLDRVVVFEHEVWVLDFKRQILDAERA